MRANNDWRLTNQQSYLHAVPLKWQAYRPMRGGWDHDHCEFCAAKFAGPGLPDALHEGYSTLDGYRWVCKACFDDFLDLFSWQVAPNGAG